MTKPPLGVMPKQFWLERRAADLIRAICEYTAADPQRQNRRYAALIWGWETELEGVLAAWAQVRTPSSISTHWLISYAYHRAEADPTFLFSHKGDPDHSPGFNLFVVRQYEQARGVRLLPDWLTLPEEGEEDE